MTRLEQVVREIETPDGTIKDPQLRFGDALSIDPALIAKALNLPPDASVHWEMLQNGQLVISFECYRWSSECEQPESRPSYLGMQMHVMSLNTPFCHDKVYSIEASGIKTHRHWKLENPDL